MIVGKRILITCGPTWVPIDKVRVVSNVSTGELGHLLAENLKKAGAHVTLVEGPVTHPLKIASIKRIKFHYFSELKNILARELRKPYDCVIHAAAVSDYQLRKSSNDKISSGRRSLTLNLVPTPKLIETIKRINPKIFLVGFKLESNLTKNNLFKKTQTLFGKARCDLVVANSSHKNKYNAFIVSGKKEILSTHSDKKDLAKHLVNTLSCRL